jgi:DNA-binding PadR family transcriptional regulator
MTTWKEAAVQLSEYRYLNVPNLYQPHHVIVSLLLIGENEPLGRYDLSENLTIGEGSIRTLLKRLTERGYIVAELRQGQRLTKRGREMFNAIRADMPFGLFLELGNLVLHEHSYASLVTKKAERVLDGVRQRDEAMIQGGHGKAGATTLVMKGGMLVMPPDCSNVLLTNEKESLLIIDTLRPEEDDVIVIGSAINNNLAKEVSVAAALTLF